MTVLVDSSVWIEFLRGSREPSVAAVRRAIAQQAMATTDVIVLEVLSGAPQDKADRWASLLATGSLLAQQPWDDVVAAARIFQTCRRAGHTPRSTADCLIAAVAIRNQVPILHRDRDFDVIGQHTELQTLTS